MSPFRGPRPVRETAGGQSALTSGLAPAHRRPTGDYRDDAQAQKRSCAGAEEAAAAAARDNGIPEDRHAANTSRLEATASGSSAMFRTGRRRLAGSRRPARTRTRGELTVISTAAARSNEARLMTAPDR